MIAVAAVALAACASDTTSDTPSASVPNATASASPSASATTTAAAGTPIKLMTLTSETGPVVFPEIPIAARAAAKNINDAGGVAGHPIEIITCDTRFDPNGAGDCGRKAVAENVAAVVGSLSPDGDVYVPILEEAGIPLIANLPNAASENTSEISFPITATALSLVAAAATLKADGASSVQYLGPNVPAYVGIIELVKDLLPQVGIEFAGSTLYPVEATDYTQYVASAYGSGADSVNVTFISSASVPAFVNAVDGGGYSFDDTPTATFGSTFKPSVLDGQLSGKLDGLFVINAGQTPTDTSLPGIATFHSEVAAAGTPLEYTDAALAVWTGVHAIARILATAEGDVTAASTVLAAARSAGPMQMPGWTPFDWSKPALPGELATAFPRYFNATVWVSKIVDNAEVAAVSAPAPFTGPITLTAP